MHRFIDWSIHESRTKTFTGCWTCRSRRLKCDEKKPSCRQCTRRGLNCGGYSARLQWLGPGDNEPGLRGHNTTGCRFQQRRLLPGKSPSLVFGRVANMLVIGEQLASSCNDGPLKRCAVGCCSIGS